MRILSLNTWKNDGDYPRRLTAMIAGLRAAAPDIVLLQECFHAPTVGADTAATLAAALDLTLVAAPARAKPRLWQDTPIPSTSGLAVLARFPCLDSARLVLPTSPAGGERIAFLVRLRPTSGPELVIGNLHLSHLRADDPTRRAQLETILAHPWWHTPAALRVLGGDANSPLDSPALAWLPAHPTLTIIPLISAPRPIGPGCPIDHLWTIAPHGETAPTPTATGVALKHPDPTTGLLPSDHAAPWVDFL